MIRWKLIALTLICAVLSGYSQLGYCRNEVINSGYLNKVEQSLTNAKKGNSATLYIPVVFHIVYNNATENVHDSLIIKQLNTLNNDFKRLNADTVNTPIPFKSVANKMDIQFCFASKTPSNVPTTGINRVFTSKTFFNAPPNYTTPDSLKHSNLGGADAWNTASYLNIWIGNLTNVSGYAAPPSNMMVSEDGVGVDHKTLGTLNSTPPYNKGRTVTHEVGHFFGLRHIWGDDGGACTGTDFMGDTPNQGNFTSGSIPCNSFPLFDACTTGGNGVMFMNFMDYSNDLCRNMFTTAQCNYMLAVINCCRTGFLSTTVTDCYVNSGLTNARQKSSEMLIYPNPVENVIKVSGVEFPSSITIMNVLGQTVLKVSDGNALDVSQLKTGIYFVRVNDSETRIFIKK